MNPGQARGPPGRCVKRVTCVGETEEQLWHLLTEGAVHYAATILSVGVLVATAFWLRSWYQDDSDPAGEPLDLLLQFKELQRQGDLTPDEYRSISGQLTGESAESSAGSPEGQAQQALPHGKDQQDAPPENTNSGGE